MRQKVLVVPESPYEVLDWCFEREKTPDGRLSTFAIQNEPRTRPQCPIDPGDHRKGYLSGFNRLMHQLVRRDVSEVLIPRFFGCARRFCN